MTMDQAADRAAWRGAGREPPRRQGCAKRSESISARAGAPWSDRGRLDRDSEHGDMNPRCPISAAIGLATPSRSPKRSPVARGFLSAANRAVGRSNGLENLGEINLRGRRRGAIVARGSAFNVGSSRALLVRADLRYRMNKRLAINIGFVPPKCSNGKLRDGSAH